VLKDVAPQNVVVDLDVTVRKELPIQIDWAGRLPENLVLAEVTVEPQRVEIIGSKRVLENIQTIYTEKVPLDRLRDVGSSRRRSPSSPLPSRSPRVLRTRS